MIASLAALILLTQSPAPAPEEAAIAAVLDQLNAASTAADATAYFGLFTPDARFIGTDATERWSLAEFRAFAEPFFARGRGWTYTPSARVITVAPIECRCIAWFDEELANAGYGQTRGSGVLRLTDDGWKIEQYVLSFAVPNEKSDAVVQAIRGD
ncbi:uncharacterized protein (TIGR02246 family) [Brevundimonas alba]|uniref:Uncharacterized protein (TIGR02246 family) n=1 Tax=Brevundimonas alba TaxID=74314 RepID=A0A7X6BQ23_9CAUL|nr:nuclear transport factor 2 family protein [Brevundimonas alba]NJC42395.1 uncharacterized protein (TIGR02246 family) [Brevundimonas alba]